MKKQKQNRHQSLIITGLFIATFLVVILFWHQPTIVFVLEAVIGLLLQAVTKWRFTKTYLLTAILGSCAEIVCIKAGVWHYANPQILGIPLWLPFVWGNASVLFIEFAQQIDHKELF